MLEAVAKGKTSEAITKLMNLQASRFEGHLVSAFLVPHRAILLTVSEDNTEEIISEKVSFASLCVCVCVCVTWIETLISF